MSLERNEASVQRAKEAWNAGDLRGYLELYDEGIRLYGSGPEPMDKTAVRAFYETLFSEFDGPRLEFQELFGSGDSLVIRFTLTGVHNGEFLGVRATGKA